MPNKRYNAGRAFEYRVRDYFIERGYFVLRSAGSRSPLDLVCLKAGEMIIVQCKRDGRLGKVEREHLIALGEEFGCQVQLVSREGRKLKLQEVKHG